MKTPSSLRFVRSGSLAAALASLLALPAAYAADGTWTLNGNGVWSSAGNWNSGSGPVADGTGATADFSTLNLTGNRTVTVDGAVASRTLGILKIGFAGDGEGYTFNQSGSGKLTFDNGGSAAQINNLNTSSAQNARPVISLPVLLNSSLDIANSGNSGSPWTLNSNVIWFSGQPITGNSATDVVISNVGTGTAMVAISANSGISDGALGGKVSVVQNSSTSGLYLSGNPIGSYSGGTFIKKGRLFTQQVNPGTGPITLGDAAGGDASLFTSQGRTISLAIDLPTGALGTLTIGAATGAAGTATFSGPKTLNGNTLTLAPDHPQNVVKVSGTLTGPGALDSVGTGVAQVSSVLPATLTAVSNSSAASVLVLDGANAFTGLHTVSAGGLSFRNTAAISGGVSAITPTTVTVESGSTLGLGVGTSPAYFDSSDVATVLSALGASPSTGLKSGSSIGLDTSAGNFTQSDALANLSGGGTLGLTKLGSNTLTLASANSYSGGTLIQGGTLEISDDANLGATGTALQINVGSTLDTGANVLTLTGRAVSIDSVGATFANTTDGELTLDSGITGPGALTKKGTGMLTFSAAASSISGATTVSGGTLKIIGGASLTAGGATSIDGGSSMTIGDGFSNGILNDSQTYLGSTVGSNNNSLLVTDAGSRLLRGTYPGSGTHRLYLGMAGAGGAGGNNNSLTISAGGYVYSGGDNSNRTIIGNGSSGNAVTVTGAGSQWYIVGNNLNVGNGTGVGVGSNSVSIEDGGFLNMAAGQDVQIGIGAISNDNSITATGVGSKWAVANTIKVGSATSTGNTINITNGATLQVQTAAPAVTIGAGADNLVNFSDATLAYKGVTSTGSNLLDGNMGATGVGLFTWTGSNTFRLEGATETSGSNYTFANNLGAKNYITLELAGTAKLARSITLDGTNCGSLLLASTNATVTGGVMLTGPVNVTASGADSSLTGEITGGGSLTKAGNAALTLNSTPDYSGDTAISAGTLALTSPNANNDASTVTLANSAVLDLDFDESGGEVTDTVAALIIGGATMPAGVYGATGSGANPGSPFTDDTHFAGGGTLTVTGGGGASAYDTWATSYGLTGGDAAFGFDYDNDGIGNGLEWILGGDPTGNDSPSILPVVTGDATTGLTLVFNRASASISETTLTVEWGDNLDPIANSLVIGAGNVNIPAVGTNPSVEIDAPAAGKVTVNIPAANASNGKLFARLKATQP